MESSALDLGTSGRDEFYGAGLVNLRGTYECLGGLACCSDGATPDDGGPSIPSPQVTDQDCRMSETAYQMCFVTKLSSSAEIACRACVNSEIPSNVYGSSCGFLNLRICPAIHEDCSSCAPCRDEIDFFLSCGIADINGCDLDCGSTSGNSEQSGSVNVFNNLTEPAPATDTLVGDDVGANAGDSPIDHVGDIDVCENAWQDMRECLVLNEARIAPNLSSNNSSGEEGICAPCVEGALSAGLKEGSSCDAINEELCPASQQCVCDYCKLEVGLYVSCRVSAETAGACQVECPEPAYESEGVFENAGSSSSRSASRSRAWTMLTTGLLSFAAWLLQ